MNIEEQSDFTQSYVAAPREFQGKPLSSYSLGARGLISSLGRGEDSGLLIYFIILYVLSHPREEVQKFTWNIDEGRTSILNWMDALNLSKEDEEKAIALAKEIVKEANKEKVDPIVTSSSGNG